MKNYAELVQNEKNTWIAVSNTIASYVISISEANHAKNEVKRTLKQIEEEEKKANEEKRQ